MEVLNFMGNRVDTQTAHLQVGLLGFCNDDIIAYVSHTIDMLMISVVSVESFI